MVQKINELGLLLVRENKNVVFKQRSLKNIYFTGGNSISIEYEKVSDEGAKTEFASVSFEKFSSIVENKIWDLVDQASETGE